MVSMHPRILCRRCHRNVYMNNNWMFGRANCGAVLLTKIFQRAQSSRQAWFPAKRNARVARIASKQLAIKLYASILLVTSLKSFSDSATHLGLDISRPKTKLQNIGSGPKPPDQSKQWVDGSWVNGSNGSVFSDGSYLLWVDALSSMTHLHIYRKHVVKATYVVGDCGGSVNCVRRI